MVAFYILPSKKDAQHHGILGMKWGVRRYQNKDGTLTAEGRQRLKYRNRTINNNKSIDKVNSIINSMSDDDKDKILAGSNYYLNFEQGSSVIKRFMKNYGDIPVSFFDVLEDESSINVILGTRSGDEYRGKGYGSKVAEQAIRWIDNNSDKLSQDKIVWGVRVDNKPSIRIAEKNGFVIDKNSYSDDGKWVNYERKVRR